MMNPATAFRSSPLLVSVLPSLRSSLQSAAQHFARKSMRERVLMMTAVLAIIYGLTDLAVLTPRQRQIRQWQSQAEAQQAETLKLNRQIATLSAQLAQQNASDKVAELQALQRIIAEADALLSEDDGGSLKLSALLDAMLRTTPGLKLVSLKTLPAVPLLPLTPAQQQGAALRPAPPVTGNTTADEPPPISVHQHGVEIVIQGNFLALLPYLDKLRRYPKRLFWTAASLEVIRHPDAQLHLTITTLSEQKAAVLE